MEKTLQIYITVDDVPLSELEDIEEQLRTIFEEYENKRIQITIQDEPMVRQPRR